MHGLGQIPLKPILTFLASKFLCSFNLILDLIIFDSYGLQNFFSQIEMEYAKFQSRDERICQSFFSHNFNLTFHVLFFHSSWKT